MAGITEEQLRKAVHDRQRGRFRAAVWKELREGDIDEVAEALTYLNEHRVKPDALAAHEYVIALHARLDERDKLIRAGRLTPAREPAHRKRKRAEKVTGQLTKEEKARADAMTAYIAASAAAEWDVRMFRERFLGGHAVPAPGSLEYRLWCRREFNEDELCRAGHVLSAMQARAFLGSAELAERPMEELVHDGTPFLPDVPQRPPLALASDSLQVYSRMDPSDWLPDPLDTEQLSGSLSVVIRSDTGTPSVVQVAYQPRSVIAALAACTNRLQMLYKWPLQHATWWILTGTYPVSRPPIAARFQGFADDHTGRELLTLEVETWLAPERLSAIYAWLANREGRAVRQRKENTMKLCRWVYEQVDAAGGLPDWPTLLERWNKESGQKPYTMHAMKQAFDRALDTLLADADANAYRPYPPA